jgi:hypothetical protein
VLEIAPPGGGMVYTVDADKVDVVTAQQMNRRRYRQAVFCMDEEPCVRGWSDGSLWNGFDQPLVELDELKRFARGYNAYVKQDCDEDSCVMFEVRGSDVIQIDCMDGQCQEWPMTPVRFLAPDGRRVEAYDIGGGLVWGEDEGDPNQPARFWTDFSWEEGPTREDGTVGPPFYNYRDELDDDD